jgi:hypothetical protein
VDFLGTVKVSEEVASTRLVRDLWSWSGIDESGCPGV